MSDFKSRGAISGKGSAVEDGIVYGMNPAFETVRAGKRSVLRAFLSDSSGSRFARLADLLKRAGVEIERTDKQSLFNLCGSREHQGVVLKTSGYPLVSFDEIRERSRLVLLDNIEDPRNLGAILRSAEIFGWNSVLLPSKGSARIYPSVVKASAGATEYLDIAGDHSSNYYARALKESGFVVMALDSSGRESVGELSGLKFEKLLLVIGGEDKSVGRFILNMADHVARIEQRGRIGSLNASVAAGIGLHLLSVGG